MELSERGRNGLKRQMTHVVKFHETKQKLFRYARAKDKRVVDLRKELKSLNKKGKTLTKEEKTKLDDLTKESLTLEESLTKEEKTKLDDLKKELEFLTKDGRISRKDLSQATDERHNTALHYAAKSGNLEACKFLDGEGADINARGQNKMTPLQFAARYGDEGRGKEVWQCMKWIMDHKQNSDQNGRAKETEVHVDGRDDFSILHHAIQNTNWEEDPVVVRELIKTRKFKITDADKQENTSLHLAAQFDKQEDHTLLEEFLSPDTEKDEKGRDYIDKKDLEKCLVAKNKVGMTPLHLACAVGNPDSVEQLLKLAEKLNNVSTGSIINVPDSIINVPDSNGSLPISLAVTSKNLKMVDILMENGAVVNQETVLTAARSVETTNK